MPSTADFKNGLVLEIDGQLWQIVEFQHVKPGKGPAFVRTKLKNVLSGKVVDKTYNAGVKVETATVDRRDTTFLYRDGMMDVVVDFRMSQAHAGARLVHAIDITPKTFMARLFSPMIRKQLPTQTITAMESLRGLLRAQP